MIERFKGRDGKRLLLEAIRRQRILQGDASACTALAQVVELRGAKEGEVLIAQGATDNDLYLVLSGSVDVRINGRSIATRVAGDHVGELSLVDPGGRRSATVIVREPSVTGRVSEPAFTAIANQFPHLWRALALEIGERLRQRTKFVAPPNDRPIVFIGCSTEALSVAEMVRVGVQGPDLEVRLWTDGIFTPSRAPMEDLESQLAEADFAILVVTADDVVMSRGKRSSAPRDNVVFEIGLFMGTLTRPRTFMIVPRTADLRLPTDLLGLNQLRYGATTTRRDMTSICNTLRATIAKHGPR